jgi:uncharacterized membrane protein
MRTRDLRLLVPAPVRELPADLAATAALTVLAALSATLPVVSETPLRVVLGLPLVLFLPGYALIAALFPEAGEGPPAEPEGSGEPAGEGADANASGTDDGVADSNASGIDGIERVALSFGLSIAVVPLLGLVLNFTPWGIRLVPILVAVGGFTLAATALAARRRRELPASERFAVPYETWVADARAELFEPDSRADAALNVLLVLSVLLATASVAYAVAVPKQGEAFTEFYLLTENESGELVADNYPTEFASGEARPVVVGVGNHEHEPTNYSVAVELQRVRFEDGSGERVNVFRSNATNASNVTAVVTREERLGSFNASVPANETFQREYQIRPTMTGERMRLTFLLYRDGLPPDPSVDTAYRELHLWVNVSG